MCGAPLVVPAQGSDDVTVRYDTCVFPDSDFKQPIPSLRGANGSRECAPDDRLRDEAIHSFFARQNGLLAPLAMTT
jgi:hypothetical protein